MGASHPMRWFRRGAHRMLKAGAAVMNGTLVADYTRAGNF